MTNRGTSIALWTHVCSATNWTTVWIQNADRCSLCGKAKP